MPTSTGLALRLNRSSRTAQCGPLRISTALPSVPGGTGLGSWQHCLGHQTLESTFGHEVSHLFGSPGARAHRQSQAPQCGPLRISTALPSVSRGTELGSWQHCLGHQTPSSLPLGHEVSHSFGSPGAREHRQSEAPQRARPVVARVSHRVRLHTRVRQGQRQRKCRFRIPLARACHRTGPQ